MAKRVFFSFHYQDVVDFRANVVRNHWLTKSDHEEAGYFDASIWEKSKREGEESLKRLINGGLENTSNTCVLIGSKTYCRQWVRYEILKSFMRGNYLFGVHINGIKDKEGQTKANGVNPFEFVGVTYSKDGTTGKLWEKINSEWTEYTMIGGTSEFSCSVEEPYRDKGFNFSNWYPVYDWCNNDGYNNFQSWVK